MSQFRKKPVVIEATQWFKNGDHPQDYSKTHHGYEKGVLRLFSPSERKANEWEGDVVRYFRRPDVDGQSLCKHCSETMNEHGWIETLEGGHIACPGDWIITGVKGEHYPCKPDIFAATYESAALAAAPQGEPVATVIKNGSNRAWMSERLGNLPDGSYELYLSPPAPVAQPSGGLAEKRDCPHAAPFRYCQQCPVRPCPIGLGDRDD